jgi:negative regulator of replication initiation
MVERVTITLPDELYTRLQSFKDRLNVSGICQKAITRAVHIEECKIKNAPVPDELFVSDDVIERLRLEKQLHDRQSWTDGYEDATKAAEGFSYEDFLKVDEINESANNSFKLFQTFGNQTLLNIARGDNYKTRLYMEGFERGISDFREKVRSRMDNTDSFEEIIDETTSELLAFFKSAFFKRQKSKADQFLSMLSFIYQRHPQEFCKVDSIAGRKRKYFSRTERELIESGSSVRPRKIPKSKYWVITNNDTDKKQSILKDVMEMLGYSPTAINEFVRMLQP